MSSKLLKRIETMVYEKRALVKVLFIVSFVITMLAATKTFIVSFGLGHCGSVSWILIGSVWASIASLIFDREEKRLKKHRRKEATRVQLELALANLAEIKDIIHK